MTAQVGISLVPLQPLGPMADDRSSLTLKIRLPEPKDSPDPEAVNFFHLSFAGAEMQMMVGYVDARTVHEIRMNPKLRDLTPHISHRFAISPIGWAILRQQMEDIGKKYEASLARSTAEGGGQSGGS